MATFCVFSKHLHWLSVDVLADALAEIGFDGVDLAVRPGGHVEPERVETELPAAGKNGLRAGIGRSACPPVPGWSTGSATASSSRQLRGMDSYRFTMSFRCSTGRPTSCPGMR